MSAIRIDGYMASGKGGMTAGVKPTPRQAAADFFSKYPTMRKCSVVGVNNGPGELVLTSYRAPSFRDVTPALVATLPDTESET